MKTLIFLNWVPQATGVSGNVTLYSWKKKEIVFCGQVCLIRSAELNKVGFLFWFFSILCATCNVNL